MSLCTDSSLVNSNGDAGEVTTLRCKCWDCDQCRPMNRQKVMHKARRGQPNVFLTLTCLPEKYDTPEDAARDMKRGFVALRRRMCRKWNLKKVPFIVVFERTKQGWPHLHALLRVPFMHHKVIRAMWLEIMDAFQIDIRFIKAASQVLFYVTKYIGKDLSQFKGCKRYWSSHGWLIVKEDERPKGLFGERWEISNTNFHDLRRNFEEQGCEIEETGIFRFTYRRRKQLPTRIMTGSGWQDVAYATPIINDDGRAYHHD